MASIYDLGKDTIFFSSMYPLTTLSLYIEFPFLLPDFTIYNPLSIITPLNLWSGRITLIHEVVVSRSVSVEANFTDICLLETK